MMEKMLTEFSDSDIRFLIETVDPRLAARIDTIRGDAAIIEGMLDHEAERLFQRTMVMGEEGIMARISPRFLFEILLRQALSELKGRSYTVERTASQRIPVFDTGEVVRFLGNKTVLKYLADMLSSFTKVESYTLRVRVRKGVWRKIRFSDMDIDSLVRLCEAADEEHRFGFYKRIADLCLFILGMFPEYASPGFPYSGSEAASQLFRRSRRSAEDYEREGRQFYKLAEKHKNASILELTGVFGQLHQKFNLAKKPLNYISDNYLRFKKQNIFPSLSSS
ncbi:hypothetical protein ACFLWY_00430 [Chloroflexota bacterium]